jgi:hypothetical protein
LSSRPAGPDPGRRAITQTLTRASAGSFGKVEAVVDLRERHRVGDHRADLDLAVHVPIDNARHVDALARATRGSPDL